MQRVLFAVLFLLAALRPWRASAASTATFTLVAAGDIRLDGPVGAIFRARGGAAPTEAVAEGREFVSKALDRLGALGAAPSVISVR